MPRLRLAMFGPICHTGGSSAMALFQLVREWLRVGHEIHFYSTGRWIDPADLVLWPNFRYIDVEMAQEKRLINRTYVATTRFARGPRLARAALSMGIGQVNRVAHESDLAARIRDDHRTHRFDAFVSINRTCSDDIAGAMPVASWTQGPPRGESDFIRREPSIVRAECGWTGWALLRGGYAFKDALEAATISRSTGFIVASEWARTMWIRAGAAPDRLFVVPFPCEIQRFEMRPRPALPTAFTFLWLGRIVPRKRFVLALDAFARLRERRPGARLLIVGSPGYAGIIPRYRLPALGPGVENLGTVGSDEISSLLARTDVIFQPSENESGGAAPVEGLACGIPSVLGPTNGTSDALGDTAFRFDRYDVGAVADAMDRAMDAVASDPVGIARRARAVAEETVALPVIAARGEAVVREIIDRWHTDRRGAGPARLSGELRSRA